MANTSSVALGSMYEYQFHNFGTKKCHNPKQIVIILPSVVNILISIDILLFNFLLIYYMVKFLKKANLCPKLSPNVRMCENFNVNSAQEGLYRFI